MMVTGIFCLLAVAVGECWAGGMGTRSGQSSSESIYGGHLLEIRTGSKYISGGFLLERHRWAELNCAACGVDG